MAYQTGKEGGLPWVLLLAQHWPSGTLQNRGAGAVLLCCVFRDRLALPAAPHGPWSRLEQPHLEQRCCAQPGYHPIHSHGLVSKLNDHAFWNGRWGDCQACGSKLVSGGCVAGGRENQWGEFSRSGWAFCDGDVSLGSEGFGL